MDRINPALFSAVFTPWVREIWPNRPNLIAIDGKTSRRSHDRAADPLHLVSAFATTSTRARSGSVEGRANELCAIPVMTDRLAEGGGLKGALVSIDSIATNAKIAQTIRLFWIALSNAGTVWTTRALAMRRCTTFMRFWR